MNAIYKSLLITSLIYFQAFTSKGQTLLNQFPVSAKKIQINHSTSDPQGNLVVCGYFYGNTANLNGFTLNVSDPISSAIEHRVTAFVAKMKPNGTVLWAVPIQSNRRFYGLMYEVDPTIIGTFTVNGSSFSASDNYSHTTAQFVSVSPNGDVFVSGNTAADVLTVGTNSLTINTNDLTFSNLWYQNLNVFITRISTAGTPVWTKVLKGESMRMKEMVWKQDRIHCLIQGVVQQEIPSSGFSFQSAIGLRTISLNSSGAVQSEKVTVTHGGGEILRAQVFPSHHNPADSSFYLPITYTTSLNSTGSFQKFNSSGTLTGVENTSAKPDVTYGVQGLTTTQSQSYYVSHNFSFSGAFDTTTIFQNTIPYPSSEPTAFLLNRFNPDGCLEWSRIQTGEVYNLTTDAEENVYGLIWDTLSRQSAFGNSDYGITYYGDTVAPGGNPILLSPKPAAMRLVKYNRKGSKVLDIQLPMYERPDNMIPWDFIFGNDWHMPGAPLTIARIKNDTITLAGGKVICHIKDNTEDSIFIINPVTCDPKVLFRPISTEISKRNSADASEILLSPNPASESLTVLYSKETEANTLFTITDLQGKNVLRKKSDGNLKKASLDISHLSPGFYLITIENGQNAVSKRFVKQ